jgi:nicotinate-nucleotide pyrophosphorylase (carboxylating)
MNAGARLLPLLIEPVVRMALLEDLGRAGDITSDAVIPADLRAEALLVSREHGVLAGLDVAALAFHLMHPALAVDSLAEDGARIAPGSVVARVHGPARPLLGAERVALNFLCRLSGIASATRLLVDALAGTHARIVCTRKTTPGLRALEKYAVRAGGGANHRFGLDDAMLIKDNHVALAGGVRPALQRARRHAGHLVKIELEVDTLDQLEEALAVGVDAVLLDNMDPPTLARAVTLVAGRAVTEASGRITPQTAPAVAASGVDLISVGWLTHSAPLLDLGLDIGAPVDAGGVSLNPTG